jgi:hypothetical protein
VAKDRLSQDPQIHRYFWSFMSAQRWLMMRKQRQFGVTKIADSEVVRDERFSFSHEGFRAKRQ